MFVSKRRIFLQETDATGVIYFTTILRYALEALELFLYEKGEGLSAVFSKGYLLPIVHAEADIKTPLRVGDEIEIELFLGNIGNRSFSVETRMKKIPDAIYAGRTKIVHAFLMKGEETSSFLPQEIITSLQEL